MMYIVVPLRPENGGVNVDGSIVVNDKLARDCLKSYWSDHGQAVQAAEQLATKNPMVPFVILGPSGGVFETAKPKIIRKKLNEAGELVVDKEE